MVKKKLIEIKFIKDFEDLNNKGEAILKHKKGATTKASKENAKQFIELGYAEYVKEPKKEKKVIKKKKTQPKKTKEIKLKSYVVADRQSYDKLCKKYKAAIKEIDNFNERKCIYYSKFNQEKLESIGFEEGKKLEWIEKIKDSILLVNFNYEKPKIKKTKKKEEVIETEDFIYLDKNGNEKISIPRIVEHLLKEFTFKTIYGKKDETIYFYNNGIYNLRGREMIKTKTEELLKSKATTNIVNEVLEKVKRKTSIDMEEFNNIPENLVCLNNGVLNVTNKELLPFDSSHYFKNKIPIKYDEKKKCEKILKYIEEVCYPEDVPVIQEFFGFCLYRRYFIKKAIILFGEKNTGKTVLLNILTKFIGKENCSGISLQRIASKDKFSLAFLKDKYINLYDDLSANDLNDAGGFKIATGGGFITAEYKFGDSFQFLTYAKNIFATNHIPNVKNIDDDAYYERWIPIPFDNQISKDKQDNFISDKITLEDEMSGLLNWALEGLSRLLDNGEFSYKKSSEEIKVLMQRQNNPLVAFSNDSLIRDDGNKITKEMMYKIYTKWSQDKKVPRLSKEQLGRNLGKYTNYIIAKGGKERVWENVNVIGAYDIFKKSEREEDAIDTIL